MTLHSCETKPLLDAIRDQWDSLLPPRIEILSPRPRLPGEVWKPSQYRATEGLNFSNQYRRKLWLLERQIFSTFLTKYLNIGPELLSNKINSQLWSILNCDLFSIVTNSRNLSKALQATLQLVLGKVSLAAIWHKTFYIFTVIFYYHCFFFIHVMAISFFFIYAMATSLFDSK